MLTVRALAASTLISIVAASACFAAPPGVNLSWSDCGAFGQVDRVFTCDTNAGSHSLVGSYSAPVAMELLNGNEMVMDMQVTSAATPSWWQIKNYTDGTIACRNGVASANFDFTTSTLNCHDYWTGRATGGVGLLRNFGGSLNRTRILLVCAVPLSQAGPLAASLETYSFELTILNSKTVGPDACGGCTDGAMIVLNSIKLTQYLSGNNQDVLIDTPAERNYVTWAPGVVPTRAITWGAIKSLYR